jgi:hypothetical protein
LLKLAAVPRYFRALAVAATVPGLLFAGLLAPSDAAANCCVSGGPTLIGPSISGGTVTLSGSGYTPNGSVQIREYAYVPGNPGYPIVDVTYTTTANGFHYVCSNGSCHRVYGDFYFQLGASPCSPYEAQFHAHDVTTNQSADWTYPQYIC